MGRGASEEYALDFDEVERLWEACREDKDKALVGLLVWCGLRVSEAIHLRESWMVGTTTIRIPRQMSCNCWECATEREGVWKPKSKAGAREIPIPGTLVPPLLRCLAAYPNGLITIMNRVTAWKTVKKLAGEAGIRKKVFPHSLRASYATILATKGLTAAELCYVLGWSDISMGSHYIQIAQARAGSASKIREIFK